MKSSNTIIVSSKYIEEKEQQIKRLQEQLKEANEILNIIEDMYPNTIKAYFKKWGVNEEN